MRNKIIASVAVAGLLIGAGLVTSIISAPGTAAAQEQDVAPDEGPFPRISGFLGEVLDGLVNGGTITGDQADAILAAAEEKATEIKEQRAEDRELIKGFLEDGVITAEEASQLPDDHWLFSERYDEAWADGELTKDEIRPHPWRHRLRRAARLGALLDDGGITQEEYDGLSDDNPLKSVDASEYLEDGIITPQEFRELVAEIRDAG